MIRLERCRKLIGCWQYVGSGVYQNNEGDRVHVSGLRVRLNNGNSWSVDFMCPVFRKCEKLMGFNRRRSIMLYLEYWLEVNRYNAK